MPRAENRKRPPNRSGNAWGEGFRNKSTDAQSTSGVQNNQNKKKELVEKMKNIQGNKKTEPKE
ncbi:hypothetical protein D2Q93_13925 [Alicyclobacillaceae bacterium I2511]|nr:hypothetical protein D2Q93_13925 [Alicyclobacillaceae bacterium I2511]